MHNVNLQDIIIMDQKIIFFVVAIVYHQYKTILCGDIEDCERCSTQNLFLDNISTESTAKKCWVLRTHFIRYCDMCLRRCCASDDLQDHNPVCASTESDWHRHYLGRRQFYNDCAFFNFFCEHEQPARSLLWRCMFRRPPDHSDCDASSAHFDNGRRKPRLHVEKHPPNIKCEKFSHLPELSPCSSKKITPPPPSPTTKVSTTTTRPTTAVAMETHSTESPQDATTQIIVTKLETNAPIVSTNAPQGTTNVPPYTTNEPQGTTNVPSYTTNEPQGTTNVPPYTTNAPVVPTNTPTNQPTTIQLITDVELVTTEARTPKLPLPINASANPSKHSLGMVPTPPTKVNLPPCSCRNASICNTMVKTNVMNVFTYSQDRDSNLQNCRSCCKQPPPKFPRCSFPHRIPQPQTS
ncbi:uncharacterized protein [Amphiura filiformis]|uniref:uncharacterized protein n=1 Tax=Amphiura filiformis TaxID=82378 RepID=UPI003B21FE0D